MAQTSPSRDRILASGLELLSVVGFSGLTLGLLAEKAGLSKSGLFAHFRSKEQLQLALIDYMVHRIETEVAAPAMAAPAGMVRVKALVGLWLDWPARTGLPGGDPWAAALFELDDLAGPVRDRMAAAEAAWRERLAGLAREAIARDEFRPNLDLDQFVFDLTGAWLSRHVSSRLLRDRKGEVRAERAVALVLRRAQVPAPAQGPARPEPALAGA